MTGGQIQDSPINSWQAILVFIALVCLILAISAVRKVIYRYKYRKRLFIIPRVGTKGLAYIGMVMAVSVTAILVLSAVSSGAFGTLFRAFPGSRVAVEAVLIKIGGLVFGPIIGMVIGAAVDILTVALSAGVFHYGYLVAAMAYGLLAGFVRVLVTYSRTSDLRFAVWSTIVIAVTAGIMLILLYVSGIFGETVEVKLISTFYVSRSTLTGVICAFLGLLLLALWGAYAARLLKRGAARETFKYLAPVITMVVISEVVINVLLLPVFDVSITGNPWSFWFSVRLATVPVIAVINVIIIFAIYRIVAPLIKYEYERELVEDLSVPLTSQ